MFPLPQFHVCVEQEKHLLCYIVCSHACVYVRPGCKVQPSQTRGELYYNVMSSELFMAGLYITSYQLAITKGYRLKPFIARTDNRL